MPLIHAVLFVYVCSIHFIHLLSHCSTLVKFDFEIRLACGGLFASEAQSAVRCEQNAQSQRSKAVSQRCDAMQSVQCVVQYYTKCCAETMR